MLFVANDTGSRELCERLVDLGLPAELEHLPFGDIVFMGRGEKGAPLYIGIEYKKVTELVGSLRSKRFQGHQLLGLTRDFDRRYLLVEGLFNHDDLGRPTVARGKQQRPIPGASNAVVLEMEYLNLQTRGGIVIKETTSLRNSLRFIQTCYRYWTDKDLDEHKSHLAMYAPDLDKVLNIPMSGFRVALNQLLKGEGMGAAGSKAVETACQGSMRRLCLWSVEQWASLEIPVKGGTKKLGMTRAKSIMEKLG